MSSFMGLTAFFGFLKKTIEEDFLAYSLDVHGPQSEYSLHWQLEFKTASCPPALAEVSRIYWTDHKYWFTT